MKKYILIVFFILLLFPNISYANSVKISLIEKITHFIDWPYLENNFKIAIYKDENLVYKMKDTYSNKLIHKLPVKIFNIENINDVNLHKIDLIYFTQESSTQIDKVIRKIANLPILIITDYPNDVYNNMHLGIYFKNRKISFIINKELLNKSNLKSSHKLLQLAKIVKKANDE